MQEAILKESLKMLDPRVQMHPQLARAQIAQNIPGVGEATALELVYQLGRFLSVELPKCEARRRLAGRGDYAP